MSAQTISRVFEGTWEELQSHANELSGKYLRVEIVDVENAVTGSESVTPQRGLRKGMFPELRDLDEEDFRCAEWRGEGQDF